MQPLMPGPGVIPGQGGPSISLPPRPLSVSSTRHPAPPATSPPTPAAFAFGEESGCRNRKSQRSSNTDDLPSSEVTGPRPHDLSGSEPGFKPRPGWGLPSPA